MRQPRLHVAATERAIAKSGISRTTAWRLRKRGWFCPNYHRKAVVVDLAAFDPRAALNLAHAVYYRHFWPSWSSHREDLIQEAALRLLETSGLPGHAGIRYGIARNAMRGYIDRLHCRRLIYGLEPNPQVEAVNFANEEEVLDQLCALAGKKLFLKALAGDQEAINSLRDLIWN